MARQKSIVFVAGKSGGHIIPALTLAQKAKEKNTALSIYFFSGRSALDLQLSAAAAIVDEHMQLDSGIRPKKLFDFPAYLFFFLKDFTRIFFSLVKNRPEKVVSTGGVIAIPVFLVAWILRIPRELWELNVEPGAAVQLLARWATTIHVCFHTAQHYFPSNKVSLASYPLRLPNDCAENSREYSRSVLSIDPQARVIMVLGGSQGSQSLNTIMMNFCEHFSSKSRSSLFILHQAGMEDVSYLQQRYKELGIAARVVAFVDAISLWYAAADGVISRAGAGALFELAFLKKKTFLIPLEIEGNTHQCANALAAKNQWPNLFFVARQRDVGTDISLLQRWFEVYVFGQSAGSPPAT